ncbi:hypothetical protein BKA82DRAFT_4360073 [Pisolithus tinctorius]|nr:hypothetical protein BKA82DRAFT_4360073 [Pisolithus tinctorius]
MSDIITKHIQLGLAASDSTTRLQGMMLSSLSLASFLPSILQPNTPPPTTSTIGLPDDKNGTMTPTADAPNPRKKSKKDRPPNETFIVVRPPPSKSIHPLNLQVQLVPPQSRVASSSSTVQALDSSHQNGTTDSSDLARTSSDRSDYSGYTSATSVSSFASTSTTSSGRRTIIPLYNLQAHHVMTNTIVDAGTDAKVAKFIKRGLEIVGLAILEPIEVWGSAPLPRTMPPEQTTTNIARTSIDDPQREFGAVSPRLSPRTYPASKDRPSTSYSTVSALDRDPYHRPPPAINVTLPPTDNSPLSAGDKKDPSRTLSVAVPTSGTDPQAPPSAPPRITSHNVARGGPLPLRDPSHSGVPESAPYAQLGFGDGSLSPTPMTGGSIPFGPTPPGRPTKYVWVIRKWLKGTETGLLKRHDGETEYQWTHGLEWERGKKKQREKDRVRGKRQMGESHNETGQKQQTTDGYVGSIRRAAVDAAVGLEDQRLSIVSQHSNSDTVTDESSIAPHNARSQQQHRRSPGTDEDSGDDSDPEDSETPWIFATLSPTPHHPKVVGLLKVPFPLPDIEVEQMAVRKRIVTAHGVSRTTAETPATSGATGGSGYGGLVLTAEEIKDTISSTALWLVVREAFGGIGRDRKRGEGGGWRMRP